LETKNVDKKEKSGRKINFELYIHAYLFGFLCTGKLRTVIIIVNYVALPNLRTMGPTEISRRAGCGQASLILVLDSRSFDNKKFSCGSVLAWKVFCGVFRKEINSSMVDLTVQEMERSPFLPLHSVMSCEMQ
jgi:hypothetical protein